MLRCLLELGFHSQLAADTTQITAAFHTKLVTHSSERPERKGRMLYSQVPKSFTVSFRYSGHPRDRDLVSVIARVRNSGMRENFNFNPFTPKSDFIDFTLSNAR